MSAAHKRVMQGKREGVVKSGEYKGCWYEKERRGPYCVGGVSLSEETHVRVEKGSRGYLWHVTLNRGRSSSRVI
jgi:hypothetical protein